MKCSCGCSVGLIYVNGVFMCAGCVQAQFTMMLDALETILPYIPTTSASEGGASAHSENVKAADKVRAAIATVKVARATE